MAGGLGMSCRAGLGLGLALLLGGCGGSAVRGDAPPWPTPPPLGPEDARRALVGEWVEAGPVDWAARPTSRCEPRARLIFTADGVFEALRTDRPGDRLGLYTAEPAPGGLAVTIHLSAEPAPPPAPVRVKLDGDRLQMGDDPRTFVRADPLDGRLLSGTWFDGDLEADLARRGDFTQPTPALQRALDGALLNNDSIWFVGPDLRATDGRRWVEQLVVVDREGTALCVERAIAGDAPQRQGAQLMRRDGDRLLVRDAVWVSAAHQRAVLGRLAALGFRVPQIVPTTLPEPLRRSPWAEPPTAAKP